MYQLRNKFKKCNQPKKHNSKKFLTRLLKLNQTFTQRIPINRTTQKPLLKIFKGYFTKYRVNAKKNKIYSELLFKTEKKNSRNQNTIEHMKKREKNTGETEPRTAHVTGQ